jgi:hypothetical protein
MLEVREVVDNDQRQLQQPQYNLEDIKLTYDEGMERLHMMGKMIADVETKINERLSERRSSEGRQNSPKKTCYKNDDFDLQKVLDEDKEDRIQHTIHQDKAHRRLL